MKKDIKYKLVDIDDSQFAIFSENFEEGKDIAVCAVINFASSKDGTDLRCKSRLELKQDVKLILVTEIICKYSIIKNSWEDVDEYHKKLPSEFIRHITSIAIGTQRGIILVRTKGSPLHKILLPPVNLADVIKKDYIIEQQSLDK